MRYFKPISFALMFLILAILALYLAPGCATLQDLIGQPHYETFELVINGQETVINLPEDLPSMDEATNRREHCWDAKLCRALFCLSNEPGHDHVGIFYSGKNVVALVWNDDKVWNYWLYIEKIPIKVSKEKLERALDAIWRIIPK